MKTFEMKDETGDTVTVKQWYFAGNIRVACHSHVYGSPKLASIILDRKRARRLAKRLLRFADSKPPKRVRR